MDAGSDAKTPGEESGKNLGQGEEPMPSNQSIIYI